MDVDKLKELVGKGLSTRKIASSLDCSQSNINYWLKKLGLTTKRPKCGYSCKGCGEAKKTKMMKNGKCRVSRSWCKACHNKATIKRGRTNRKKLVDYMGGSCSQCGYAKCIEALEFHHLDGDKDVLFSGIRYWAFDRAKKELSKCALLCANCHREKHFLGL